MKMKLHLSNATILLAAGLIFATASRAPADVRYVDCNSTNAAPPYTNWATAALAIQDAVDAAAPGDDIVVTNGAYAVGARAMYGNNRVAVTKPVTVRSVNGPAVTSIIGSGLVDSAAAVRCVYLTNGAVLAGFTLTNGATQSAVLNLSKSGGGVWCESVSAVVVSNCVLTGNAAYISGGGAYSGTLNNCILTNNHAAFYTAGTGGGGAYGATLNGCTLTSNSAAYFSDGYYGNGGGAHSCTLNNCTLSGNVAGTSGGGAWSCTLNHCALIGNSVLVATSTGGGATSCNLTNCILSGNVGGRNGGGAYSGLLYNCVLTANSALTGGGAYSGTLYNCVLTANSARDSGGGAYSGTLYNCTVIGNSTTGTSGMGGGAYSGTLNNCIVYYNSAHFYDNYSPLTSLNYCCTTPLPAGTGNLTNAPLFVDQAGGDFRLLGTSPCIDAGANAYVGTSTDLAGNPRIARGTVDMGAYEFQGANALLFYAFLQGYGITADGTTDYLDADGDGFNNWKEWRCGTCPTNALSLLRLLSAVPAGADVAVTWQSASGVPYYVDCCTNLGASPAFVSVATNLAGQADVTTFTHAGAAGAPVRFYRVGVGY